MYFLHLKRENTIWAFMQENPSSGICEQQSRRPACASGQTDDAISAFVIYLMECIISKFASREITIF